MDKFINTQYIVREPHDLGELETLLQLRYQMFLPTGAIAENEYEIDLDYFDQNSIHIGLFVESGTESKAIGAMRLVVSQPTHHCHLIQKVALDKPFFTKKLAIMPKSPLPFFNYVPFLEALNNFQKDKPQIFEASRNCIKDRAQAASLSGFLIEASTGISISYLPNYEWFAASWVEHECIYKRYGFRRIPGTESFEYPQGRVACILHSNIEMLSDTIRNRIVHMRDEFEKYGEIALTQ